MLPADEERDRRHCSAVITVYLALTITILLSLLMALFMSARMGAVRMQAECATDISGNAVLAEYHRELFRQYDLLMVDTSYGSGVPSIANTQEHLKYYVDGNFLRSTTGVLLGRSRLVQPKCEQAAITGWSLAADNDGAVLRRQILAYMKEGPLEHLMSQVLENMEILQSNGFDTRDVEAEAAAKRAELDAYGNPRIVNEEGEEVEVPLDNPADAVEMQKSLGVLTLSVPDLSKISSQTIHPEYYLSHRDLIHGSGLKEAERFSAGDLLLLDQYIFEKCSKYSDELDKALLKYQVEYLIGGKDNDHDNLEQVARILLFWREASNAMYLFSCQEKVDAVDALATIITSLLCVPALKDLVKDTILFAWTFAESIVDLRILFKGGRVPLIKTDESWRLSLENLIFFRSISCEGGEGLSYQDYLRILLLMQPVKQKTMRLMDVMEMDIRQTSGNASFRMDGCLDCYTTEVVVSGAGCQRTVKRYFGYEHENE